MAVQHYYASSMFVAATGYLLFACFLLFRVDAQRAHVADRYGSGLFNVLLVLILGPSITPAWFPRS